MDLSVQYCTVQAELLVLFTKSPRFERCVAAVLQFHDDFFAFLVTLRFDKKYVVVRLRKRVVRVL